MRSSDWRSDVCSSDLLRPLAGAVRADQAGRCRGAYPQGRKGDDARQARTGDGAVAQGARAVGTAHTEMVEARMALLAACSETVSHLRTSLGSGRMRSGSSTRCVSLPRDGLRDMAQVASVLIGPVCACGPEREKRDAYEVFPGWNSRWSIRS